MRSFLPKMGGCALLAAAALFLTAGPAAASSSPIVGHVYVNDNTASSNTVAVFDRHANGTLTPHPGSPFAAGGAGSGHPVDQGRVGPGPADPQPTPH